jgi:putative transposase
MIPRGWHSRGYLPHFDSPETIQFIAFRLADSLPRHVMQALKATKEYAFALDRELDGNFGECWLAQPEIAALVQEALLHFDGERYRLLAWCLMPNHAHVVAEAVDGHSLSEVVRGWKSFSARWANKLLGRTGPFWHPDYFDRYMRNEEHLHRTIEYVEQNPVKAGLTTTARDWPWSSAAFRTGTGGMSGPGGPRSQKTDR